MLQFFRTRKNEKNDGNDDDGSCDENGRHDTTRNRWSFRPRWKGSHHCKGMKDFFYYRALVICNSVKWIRSQRI